MRSRIRVRPHGTRIANANRMRLFIRFSSVVFAVSVLACASAVDDEPAVASGTDAVTGDSCSIARPRCGTGRICTFEVGGRDGICLRPGALGAPCGGTVWEFSGGDCDEGLVCELGKMGYPIDGHVTRPEEANPSSGICRRAPGTAGACTSDRACGFGETCRAGTCLPAQTERSDAGAPDAASEPRCTAMSDCAAPDVCTFAPGAYSGKCILPGTEGGLCGSTYSRFSGGDCQPGLRCVLDLAAFPTDGLPATDRGWNVGICMR